MRVRSLVAATVVVVLVAAACSSDPEPADAESSQAFCLRLRAAVGDASAVNQIDLADPASIDAAIVELGEVRDQAPPSVADDVTIVVDAFTALVEALEAPDNRRPAEVIAEQTDALDEANEAGRRLDAYATAECGVDLSPPATPTPPAAADDDLAPA